MRIFDLYVAIIAGGQGTRLFPHSNSMRPKQFCLLNEKYTFIQETARRFITLGVRPQNIVVIITNPRQKALANEQLGGMGVLSQNVYLIGGHFGYAGAMIQAADFIHNLNEKAVIINTPADQYIESDENFAKTISLAVKSADSGYPTIVGVKVSDLNTVMGCGHAIYSRDDNSRCKDVLGFIEKPDFKKADEIMREDNSVCNTGINVWQAKTVLAAVRGLKKTRDELGTAELMAALMAGLDNLRVSVGQFVWHDCGTLKSLYDISAKTPNHKNASIGKGQIFRHDCRDSLFIGMEGVDIDASGVKDAAVVVNEVGGRIIIAVAKLANSQDMGKLAEDYQKHKNFLMTDFSVGARNNRVPNTGFSKEICVGFVGVSNYTVTAIKYPDGRIIVIVSNESDCDGTSDDAK